jgi:diguanylate cyclase (GGDEF)-like protein/PAS domain S-box-containing protein
MTHAAGVEPPTTPKRARPFAVAVSVTLALMVLSAIVAVGWRSQLQGEAREEFDISASQAEILINNRLQDAVTLVTTTGSSFRSPDRLDAESFEETVAGALPENGQALATVALVEQVAPNAADDLAAARQGAGLPDFALQDVNQDGRRSAIATFEASNRGGAAILSGYDLSTIPALREAFREADSRNVRITPLLDPLPAEVLRVHPDLGRAGFALVAPATRGTWVVALLSADDLAAEAVALDSELDVSLALGDSLLGASTSESGASIDLDGVNPDARRVYPIGIVGGPLSVTVADVDGLAGGGWREPGLLLGAGIALSILVGSLILVLARGRAGALAVASEATRARQHSEENFRAVVQHLSDLVVVTDGTMAVDFVTPSVARLLGRDASSLVGRTIGDLVNPDDRALLTALSSRSGVSEKGLIRFRHSDGSDRSFEVVVANRLDDPAIGGLVLTAHDVTDRVALEDRLAHEATHDALTGLPNKALIRDRLDHALVRAERTGSRVAVVFGDLDEFKAVNDQHGHLAGDRFLVEVAGRLRGAARAMDTVGRWAGDEFVVICEELDDEAGARRVAERLHREVVRPVDIDDMVLDVNMSLGVAMADPTEGATAVLDRADQAMYRAKVDRSITFAA